MSDLFWNSAGCRFDRQARGTLGVVDISMRQATSAQLKAGKWGIGRILAVRQGHAATIATNVGPK